MAQISEKGVIKMDKGYYLLKALGFDKMARQVRSKNDPLTSKMALSDAASPCRAGMNAEYVATLDHVLELMSYDQEA